MASDTDPVRIVVEIVDNFSDELRDLRRQLEQIDAKNLDITLDIDDHGDIAFTKALLKSLEEHLETELNIDVDGYEEAVAKKASLGGDMDTGIEANERRLMDTDQIRAVRESVNLSLDKAIDGPRMDQRGFHPFGEDLIDTNEAVEDFRSSIRGATKRAADFEQPEVSGFGDFLGRTRGTKAFNRMFGVPGADVDLPDMDMRDAVDLPDLPLGKRIDNVSDSFGNLGKKLLRYRPSIMDWWNVLAALIPVLITLAGAAIGLAAAFVAAAGAAILLTGVGLLGWGDSMSETVQNLTRDLKDLGQQLFQIAQPAARALRPIVQRGMFAMPGVVADLVDELEGLTAFEDEFASFGQGIVDWFELALQASIELNEKIGSVLDRAGSAVGSFLIQLLETMVDEVYRNQNAYVNLAAILIDVLVIIFNVVKVFGFAISQMKIMFDALAALSDILSGRVAVSMLTAIGVVVALETAAAVLFATLSALRAFTLAPWVASVFPYISAAIGKMYAFVTAATTARAALLRLLALTGAGLLVAGAGIAVGEAVTASMSPPSGGRASGGNNTYISIQGDVEKREMDRLLDRVPNKTRNEMSMQQQMGGM
jgi:hypothetical protein